MYTKFANDTIFGGTVEYEDKKALTNYRAGPPCEIFKKQVQLGLIDPGYTCSSYGPRGPRDWRTAQW